MKEQIREHIGAAFMGGKGAPSDAQPLFTSGIIDSLGFIRLISFLEKTFEVSIDVSQITIENFDTVERIARVVEASRRT